MNIDEHWETFHKQNRAGALTGTSLERLNKHFKFSHLLKNDINLLNIGVGLGFCTKAYSDIGCNVYALDICQNALDRVLPYTKGCFLHKNADSLPSDFFDVAVSYLVTQHMSDEDILWQLPHVIRSLKDTGRLYIQFSCNKEPRFNNIKDKVVGDLNTRRPVVSMLNGTMCRTREYAEDLVNDSGGEVVDFGELTHFPPQASFTRTPTYHFYFCISKKGGK